MFKKEVNLNVFKINKNVLSAIWYLFTNFILKNIWIYLLILVTFILSTFPVIDFKVQGVYIDAYYMEQIAIHILFLMTIFLIGIIQVYFVNMITKGAIGDRISSTKYGNNEFKNALLIITTIFNIVIIELLFLWIFLFFNLFNEGNTEWIMLVNMLWIIILAFMTTLFFTFIGSLKISVFVKVFIVFGIIQIYSIIGYSGGAAWANSLDSFLRNNNITSLFIYIFVVLLHIILLPFSIIDIAMSTPLFFLPENPLPIWMNATGIIITLLYSVFASFVMWWKIKLV